MFRLAAQLRAAMLAAGFTDNGGAIHGAERILNLLGLRLCYPNLSHIHHLRTLPDAPFSENALTAHQTGQQVLIEHVNPHRALTRLAIQSVEEGATDGQLIDFVRSNFRLALLTKTETQRLNKLNRSRIEQDRLTAAGIRLVKASLASGCTSGRTPDRPGP